MKLKHIALAAVLVVSGAANANVFSSTSSANQNDVLINIWDANGSFTKAIGASFGSFNSLLASGAAGDLLTLNLASDSAFQQFITGRTSFSWDIIGVNTVGNASTITSFNSSTAPTGTAVALNTGLKTGTNNNLNFIGSINNAIIGNTAAATNGVDSVYTNSSTAPTYVTANGSAATGAFVSSLVVGSEANNSFANGLYLLKEVGSLTGTSRATTTLYSGVTAYIDSSNTLHIGSVAAVPEPESLAMLLAGLGMVGAVVARRRKAA